MKEVKPVVFILISIVGAGYLISTFLPTNTEMQLLMPHFVCLAGNEAVISVFQVGDYLTFGAYIGIGSMCMAIFFTAKYMNWGHRFWFALTGFFIYLCGVCHLLDALNLYESYYWLDAILTLITGLFSFATLVYSTYLAPKVWRGIKLHNKELAQLQEKMKKLKTDA